MSKLNIDEFCIDDVFDTMKECTDKVKSKKKHKKEKEKRKNNDKNCLVINI
jgi:hypothetical protein